VYVLVSQGGSVDRLDEKWAPAGKSPDHRTSSTVKLERCGIRPDVGKGSTTV